MDTDSLSSPAPSLSPLPLLLHPRFTIPFPAPLFPSPLNTGKRFGGKFVRLPTCCPQKTVSCKSCRGPNTRSPKLEGTRPTGHIGWLRLCYRRSEQKITDIVKHLTDDARTWKYDVIISMSHERLCVICFVVWPATIILNYKWLTMAKRE